MILTIGPGGCGFTFLNWSIAYLRGDSYYYTLNGVKTQVDINPLTGRTAHRFGKDHLNPNADRSILSTASANSIIYIVPGDDSDFKSLIAMPDKKIIFNTTKFCQKQLARHYITVPDSPFVSITSELGPKYGILQIKKVLLDLANNFFLRYYNLPVNTSKYYIVDYQDMFGDLDIKILDIFKFLNLTIDATRHQSWQEIYKNYKLLNNDILTNFTKDIDNVDLTNGTQILKELINWKNGSYQNT